MNKKGNSVVDAFYIVMFIVIFAIVTMICFKVNNTIQPSLESQMPNDGVRNVTANVTKAFVTMDFVIVMVAILLFMITVVSAYFIDTHPVFFVVSLVMVAMFLMIVPMMANLWDSIAGTSQFTTERAAMPTTDIFLSNLPLIFLAFAGLGVIATYAKYRSQ